MAFGWSPPPLGWLKLNVDGFVHLGGYTTLWGMREYSKMITDIGLGWWFLYENLSLQWANGKIMRYSISIRDLFLEKCIKQ